MTVLIHRNTLSDLAAGRATLPASARSPLNRCNLPSVILGSLTFQMQPIELQLDSVLPLNRQLFAALDRLDSPEERGLHFRQYMSSAFLLDQVEEAGFDPASQRRKRAKADYLRLLRGWMFNPDGIEAAVLKRWVESRFGLLTRYHGGLLKDYEDASYAAYQADVARGLYNANALESQLDLLYTYCQYELARRWPEKHHWLLYRGVNNIPDRDRLAQGEEGAELLLLNNLNSFSSDRELAGSFGDWILETRVPTAKLLYFPDLLPNILKGEEEYLVIGGVYRTYLQR
ncbi:NAD(+)--dinitrogen-reductase ADP-D-ribosyltransferase [Marinospirillum perlucidum]|uniref:NAD(+)--dinitrogen-reductase ADP-D-ribosyltransferase n=1 Tax=Marinospirillum perlucidum TaxID=1982602 RepID=UPI000DF3F068|nr:NAD(+)--dinitrogen-reductase ADP-D-ribosyltransferase [Marinospirillum perlucidum]